MKRRHLDIPRGMTEPKAELIWARYTVEALQGRSFGSATSSFRVVTLVFSSLRSVVLAVVWLASVIRVAVGRNCQLFGHLSIFGDSGSPASVVSLQIPRLWRHISILPGGFGPLLTPGPHCNWGYDVLRCTSRTQATDYRTRIVACGVSVSHYLFCGRTVQPSAGEDRMVASCGRLLSPRQDAAHRTMRRRPQYVSERCTSSPVMSRTGQLSRKSKETLNERLRRADITSVGIAV